MRGRQSRKIIFLDDNMYNDLDAYRLRAMSNTGTRKLITALWSWFTDEIMI